MAKLTDKQRKQIIADKSEGLSLRKLAAKYNVSSTTIHRVLKSDPETEQIVSHKKEQNTADILSHMETKRDKVCEVIDIALDVLPQKIYDAKTASDVTTALGTLIDKWTAANKQGNQTEDKVTVVIDV